MTLGITPKEQQIIADILAPYRDEYAFYYYGSRGKGNFEPTSDLDILVKGPSEVPFGLLEEWREKFDRSDLPYVVNFSDNHRISADFYAHIEKDLLPAF